MQCRGEEGHDTGLALLAALQQDGRASHAEPAAATGWSPATVGRRPDELQSSGALFFDVDLDDTLLGATAQALLWMSVAPAHLDTVARTPATTSRPSSPRPPGRPTSSPRPCARTRPRCTTA
ncbi:Lrp/AsnC family transcriptional regulator [Streptomyces sp. SAS_270]|uniref:Lrp/AsnC family transcriptional regulator n=1 Tax=Streptomyces sp. SAS_270 TaxID=3412748 RepID=UPI00403CEE28